MGEERSGARFGGVGTGGGELGLGSEVVDLGAGADVEQVMSARSTASRTSSSLCARFAVAVSRWAAARATRRPVWPPSQSGTTSCTPAFQSVV